MASERPPEIEIIPPGADRQRLPPLGRAPSPFLRNAILVAVIAVGLGFLSLLVVFAATIALVAVPVAISAAAIAWLGLKWRRWKTPLR